MIAKMWNSFYRVLRYFVAVVVVIGFGTSENIRIPLVRPSIEFTEFIRHFSFHASSISVASRVPDYLHNFFILFFI